ncbi:unnamed protein product [Mucor circinelloides]|uniref:Vesicle transport protein USE1 n=1 Tax=Mucor circinelloides f. circinelloides (strain 1006PhL) TaxID=1220926 RepID=S2K798_MUCC1|nr:hypothetical protein HMPREF1544_01799 [Mucor circinelloides 1006PhL]KAG1097997.1 hypothetical protein G6F42_018076 [Rhizopus arrhizus]
MLNTTDEINLHRLLISCENKLKEQPIDVWTASEKRKFATYVKYLATLQKKSNPANVAPYAPRIDQLTRAVAVHTMHVDVDKGIVEARLGKKRLLEELKQYESPDPEWLLELKRQDERAAQDELDRKKKLLEQEEDQEEDQTEQKDETEEDDQDNPLQDTFNEKTNTSEIRQRNTAKNETSNIEHVLHHHRQMHDELTTDLGRMAKQLKINSQAFGDTLSKDDVVLKEAQQAVESNLTRMTKERQRLDVHYSKSWGTSFMTMAVVLFVCIMFVLVFFTIKFLPKAT